MIMRRLIVLPFLFLAICCIGQSIELQIEELSRDSAILHKSIANDLALLDHITKELQELRASIKDSSGHVAVIGLGEKREVYQVRLYQSDPVKYHYMERFPVVQVLYSYRAGVIGLRFYTYDIGDYNFSKNLYGGSYYVGANKQNDWVDPGFVRSVVPDSYLEGPPISFEPPRPKYPAAADGHEMYLSFFIYMDREWNIVPERMGYFFGSVRSSYIDDLLSGDKKPPKVKYKGYK